MMIQGTNKKHKETNQIFTKEKKENEKFWN